jgi:MscS family membrane protein
MTMTAKRQAPGIPWLMTVAILASTGTAAFSSTEHPLEPPDRSSPRATLMTFLQSVDRAWELYEADDPGFVEEFQEARDCLDLSQIPPLVAQEVSARDALILKEILDRIELPPWEDVPNRTVVEELGLTRWTIPHTEIRLLRVAEGDLEGQWLFTPDTIDKAESYLNRVRDVPYRPGRTGGHIEELRAASDAMLLKKLVDVMPPWFRGEVAGVMVWQWFGLALLVALLASGLLIVAWVVRRLKSSQLPWRGLARYFLPLAMMAVPFLGRFMIGRLFTLPGAPALYLRVVFSVVGFFGFAWLMAVIVTRIGDLTVKYWFRAARPLKKQLVRVVFRVATIVVVTTIAVLALQRLGVPVAGLIAGVGVGGLAIALAAQSTLENFIGGIILYADQPVKVGDFCKFGDRRGLVEDVGLRSVKIRTLDRTIVTVPNADFARLQLENLADRDRVLLRENLRLRYETTRDQLEGVMSDIETMLKEHERLADDPLRVRFTGFGEYFLEIELYAYALTSAWPDFLEIREDIMLKVMDIVESSGTRLALPTGVRYLSNRETSEGASPESLS